MVISLSAKSIRWNLQQDQWLHPVSALVCLTLPCLIMFCPASTLLCLNSTLSVHRFLCLPLFLFPSTGPWKMVFVRAEDLVTWPNHLSFLIFTVVRSSWGPCGVWSYCAPFHLWHGPCIRCPRCYGRISFPSLVSSSVTLLWGTMLRTQWRWKKPARLEVWSCTSRWCYCPSIWSWACLVLHEIVHENANDKSRFNFSLSQKQQKFYTVCVTVSGEREKKRKGEKRSIEVAQWVPEMLFFWIFYSVGLSEMMR